MQRKPASGAPFATESGTHGAVARIRALVRAARFGAILLAATLEFWWLAIRGRMRSPVSRAHWLQRICRRLVHLCRIQATCTGPSAARGFLVCNHVSYLDIVVLSAREPLIFVAKQEVRTWPVVGTIAAWAGTIFIDRTRRSDVVRVRNLMRRAIVQGARVCLFPEGTSSGGLRVLPFRSSLLELLTACATPATAGWLGYTRGDGEPDLEAAYWGDMVFIRHFWELLHRRKIFARVAFAPAPAGCRDRKELARELHALVSDLGRNSTAHGRVKHTASPQHRDAVAAGRSPCLVDS